MALVAVPMMLAPTLGPLTGRHPHPDAQLALDLLREHRRRRRRDPAGVPLAALTRERPGARPRRSTSSVCADVDRSRRRSPMAWPRPGPTALVQQRSRVGPGSGRRRCWWRRSCSMRCVIKNPLLDLRLYRRWHFSAASIVMFALGAAVFGAMILMPLYWQELRGYSVIETGLLTAPQGLGMAITMPLAGAHDRALRRRPGRARRCHRDGRDDDPVRSDRRAHLRRVPVRSRCSCAAPAWAPASCRR